MTTKQWSMRPYRAGDEPHIQQLFELAVGAELSEERWRWQFKDNHTGVIIITLAESEVGEVVGQCALRPVRMKIGESIGLGAQSLDAMVHPDYRRQGMFTKLAIHTYEAAARKGIGLVYGFPNKNSHRLLAERLKRVDLWSSPPLFAKILDVRGVLSTRIHNRFALSVATLAGQGALTLFDAFHRGSPSPDYQVQRVSRFDEGTNHVWEEASAFYGIAVVRDQQYLNWRYVENPTDKYVLLTARSPHETVGYVVLKCEERFGLRMGFVVDMLTVPEKPEVGDTLISEAVEHFRKQNTDIASCLMLGHRSYTRSLRNNGFAIMPPRLFPQELHLSVRRLSGEYTDQLITDPKNWFATWGDHDVV